MVKNSRIIPLKRGIAMIELIFSIVIMGIVLLSAPMLIQQSIQSGNVAMQQEAIAAAASQTSVVLSMHWDENNNSNSIVSPMLDVNRAPFDFNATSEPVGLTNINGRQSTDAGDTLPAVLEIDFGMDETNNTDTNETDYTDFDDVDDYHNSEFNLTVFHGETTTSDIGDYIDTTIEMNTTINYTEDRVTPADATALSGTTLALGNNINKTSIGTRSNIKFINVNLTSNTGASELDKNITFEAFSCNIGTTMAQGANH
jgi:hypothetical protein